MGHSKTQSGRELPSISPLMLRWFSAYARRFVRKNFHALRIAKDGLPRDVDAGRPIIIAMNHPGWWDPMIALVLSEHLFPDRMHFAPIDATMLARYQFFAKLGFFGVDSSLHGGSAFLRTSLKISRTPGTCLWITAQGQFADPRLRPITFARGLPRLLAHLDDSVTVLPLAIEYPFWSEREPEALVRFGDAIERSRVDPATGLEEVMNELARIAITKDASKFEIIVGGSTGTSAIYDAWRRIKHTLSRERSERFSTAHLEDVRR